MPSVAAIPRMRTATPIRKPLPESSAKAHNCTQCGKACVQGHGSAALEEKNHKIAELEAQVRLLAEKAASAVDKLADYEDQLHKFKSGQVTPADDNVADSPVVPSPRTSRFSSVFSTRSTANLAVPVAQPPAAAASDLQAALAHERDLRQKAEGRVSQMNVEIEDLSVTLFQQANEMVAEERKARAKLEERVEVLEKRDQEKRKRLERLEGAMKRIERVSALLKV